MSLKVRNFPPIRRNFRFLKSLWCWRISMFEKINKLLLIKFHELQIGIFCWCHYHHHLWIVLHLPLLLPALVINLIRWLMSEPDCFKKCATLQNLNILWAASIWAIEPENFISHCICEIIRNLAINRGMPLWRLPSLNTNPSYSSSTLCNEGYL